MEKPSRLASKHGLGALALGASLLLAACGTDALGDKYVAVAQCLTEKGVTMYGAYWCPHCANQKAAFGEKAFEEIKYVECDARGAGGNPQLCIQEKIESYPTWDFADGSRLKGEQTPEELAEKAGCAAFIPETPEDDEPASDAKPGVDESGADAQSDGE